MGGGSVDAGAGLSIHSHAGPPVAAQVLVRGVQDSGVGHEGSVGEEHVHLPGSAIVAVELVHTQHGAALGVQATHEHLRLSEGGVSDDSGRPVPLGSSGGPRLEGADVGRLVGAVVVQKILLSLLIEESPDLATILGSDGDLELLVLHDPDVNVLGLSVAGPLVLSQVRELGTAHVHHRTLKNVITATIIGGKLLGSTATSTDLHTDGTTLDGTLLEEEVRQQVSRQSITVHDVHLCLLDLDGSIYGRHGHSGNGKLAHCRHFSSKFTAKS
mmetsp:Transcript_9165/g.15717  ORF Transcript_9165/g.15717 Transcript_9165/m.15717 type:complete len:271 (-) Transcript_9165:6-818(-)